MNSSMKLSKRVEDQKSVDCLDRISRLSDELLGHVLSFLPTKGTVSTSILSTRWRNLFTLTNCLYFDDSPCLSDSDANKETKAARQIMFKKFVYNVLELHQVSPIKNFSLVCRGIYDESDLNAWVSAAVQKGVQDLHCEVSKQMGVLPEGLFLCESLARLKLICYPDYELKIPLSARLTSLRILTLEYILFPDYDSVGRLFSSCELLEELTLMCCRSDTKGHVILSTRLLKVLIIEDCEFDDGLIEIDAPNLTYLSYGSNTGVKIVPSWKDSSSFVKADLIFTRSDYEDVNVISLQYDRELLKAAACKTTTLHLLSDYVELLLPLDEHEEMPNFYCLTRLHLHYFPYNAWKCVTSLLDKSPQLETVVFEWGLHRCYCDPESPTDATLIPFSCNVKLIEVRSFCKHEGSLLLLGHLLINAGALERLIVHTSSNIGMEEEQRISKDLSMLPRASRDCCIELK